MSVKGPWRKHGSLPGKTLPAAMPSMPGAIRRQDRMLNLSPLEEKTKEKNSLHE